MDDATGARVVPAWARWAAMTAPLVALVLGIAMSVQWELGGPATFDAPVYRTVGPWIAEHVPLMDGSDPRWLWRGPFFVAVLLPLPLVWAVTGSVRSRVGRWLVRGGMGVAAVAIALEYNTAAGYGWLVDLAGLLAAIVGTVVCGLSGLRSGALRRPAAWWLVAALPLTPIAGFLTFWYLPPSLTMGLLISWAAVAAQPKSHSTTTSTTATPAAARP